MYLCISPSTRFQLKEGFLDPEFGSGEKCVMLKAAVNPSQKAPDQANQAWIVAKLWMILR